MKPQSPEKSVADTTHCDTEIGLVGSEDEEGMKSVILPHWSQRDRAGSRQTGQFGFATSHHSFVVFLQEHGTGAASFLGLLEGNLGLQQCGCTSCRTS